jgi:ADP-ribosyl-[dinitrogen reductase] hydrolase
MENKLAALLGLHIGDSLGATLEFKGPNPKKDHTEIIGGGAFHWLAGEPTDDTQMMLCLLESLAHNPTFDIQDLAMRYLKWFESEPTDIGNTTRSALTNLYNGKSPLKSGLKGEHTQGNGSLMRCAPLCLIEFNEEIINQQAAITHAHEMCLFFDSLFIKSLNMLSLGMDKYEVYENSLKALEAYPFMSQEFEKIPKLAWEELKTSGYVFDTYMAAFWGLLNTSSFEDALIQVVNRGDDADTCGAVCGALCGAHYGMDALPKRWLDKIMENKKIINLYEKIITSLKN